ncbi:MAG: hypothetical protein NTX65_15925 [Ignavibacteriales bacterium]|nr:hypothetical protein [Ignavibacteriales bacterium]
MENCVNHPSKKALSTCHNCGQHYCELCLDAGTEYYYCKKAECQEILKKEFPAQLLSSEINCPNCSSKIELSDIERSSGKFHCPECESFIDLSVNPPKILNRQNYLEFVSSLNQGDIALIKSILDDALIDYYVFGENFLSVDPLIQPAKFYVDGSQLEEAKELLKDFKFHIYGASSRNDPES